MRRAQPRELIAGRQGVERSMFLGSNLKFDGTDPEAASLARRRQDAQCNLFTIGADLSVEDFGVDPVRVVWLIATEAAIRITGGAVHQPIVQRSAVRWQIGRAWTQPTPIHHSVGDSVPRTMCVTGCA